MITIITFAIIYVVFFGLILISKIFNKRCTKFYSVIHYKYVEDFKKQLDNFQKQSVNIIVANKLVNAPTKFCYKFDIKKIPWYYRNKQEIRFMIYEFEEYIIRRLGCVVYNVDCVKKLEIEIFIF